MKPSGPPGDVRSGVVAAMLMAFGAVMCGDGLSPRPQRPPYTVEQGVKDLSDPSPSTRASAAAGLEAMGPAAAAAVPALVKTLDDTNLFVVWSAIGALGAIGAPAAREAVPRLTRFIDTKGDETLDVRYATVLTLEALRDPRAVPALIRAFRDDDKQVRVVARRGLVVIGAPAVPALVEALSYKGDEQQTLNYASEALGDIGAPAVDALIPVLRSADPEAASGALGSLRIMGEAARPALRAVLDYVNRGAAGGSTAFRVLGQLGGPDAVQALTKGLDDSNTRDAAIEGLGRIGPAAISAEPRLVAVLRQSWDSSGRPAWLPPPDATRSAVVRTLRSIGARSPEAVDGLVVALGDRILRPGAIAGLGEMGPAARSALPALRELANSSDLEVAGMARKAIASIERQP